ncbi:FlgN protein [Symmachiella dynata]|uniref:FlgN protein n=1 Tax=Symmachiella dynata TaxID=2527995 RepID=A0A517ZKQ4_9PLAN|nr:flagellar export chaperone FlgN [Symmachiella dynata]QDT47490.1 FlgN protein [Symmachiella dynata]QDU43071.1 FlgN protein [Symmachiella dynata]
MNNRLLEATTLFMTQLEVVQGELSALMAEKRTAMTQIQGHDLARISADESVLITRLQKLLRERNRILEFAQERNLPSQSLLHLVKAIGLETRDELIARIEQAQHTAAQLRHESWVHWIISHRSFNHYTELIDLIAHCGQPSPTYHEGDDQSHTGGALLDASI